MHVLSHLPALSRLLALSLFAIPKNGGTPTIARGRSMVVYIRDKTSPTGWLSLREMAQETPPK